VPKRSIPVRTAAIQKILNETKSVGAVQRLVGTELTQALSLNEGYVSDLHLSGKGYGEIFAEIDRLTNVLCDAQNALVILGLSGLDQLFTEAVNHREIMCNDTLDVLDKLFEKVYLDLMNSNTVLEATLENLLKISEPGTLSKMFLRLKKLVLG
jgi:hypothetical protein